MTGPSEEQIARAVDRLGCNPDVRKFIDRYLKAARPLEAEPTSVLHEQWSWHRHFPVTVGNRWHILTIEIELALRGEAVDGLFRNANILTMAGAAAAVHYGWEPTGLDWPVPPDESSGNVVSLARKQRKQHTGKPSTETCRHGMPLGQECAECHGIGPDDDGGEVA